MPRILIGGLTLLLCLAAADRGRAESSAVQARSPPTVIALYGFELHTPTVAIFDRVLHREFVLLPSTPVRLHSEFIDAARFEGPAHEARLATFLRERYADKQIDLLLSPDPGALRFLLKYRDSVFPRVPVVFFDVRAATLAQLALPPDFIGVPVDVGAEPTVRLALDLCPDARSLVIVTGTAELDRVWERRLRAAVEKLAPRRDLRVLSGLPLGEIEHELASLAPGSVVLGGPFRRDGDGRTFPSAHKPLERLSVVSTAPIFHTVIETLGTGVVGGVAVSPEAMAQQAVEIARTILAGTPATEVKLPAPLAPRPFVDWRQLERWDLAEERLPTESVVMFREPTLWDRYRYQLIAVAALLVSQTVLIAALLLQRQRRRAAELGLAAQRVQLLHASRLAVAGELTASIAHEINQPLGAILSNAEAAQLLVQSGRLERPELPQILADIRRDDLRASEVIRRLRAMLARHEVERQRIDINRLVEDTAAVLRTEARRRGVTVEYSLRAQQAEVICDRVQIQQVIINLMLNAFDATAALRDDARRVMVGTTDTADGLQLTVRDFGHGIEAADLPRLFDPFFSTKSGGMGLGLSIARSIVEEHGGTIGAASREVGAEFRFVLPRATSSDLAEPAAALSP